jgi:anti-sigma factor RsiW
MKHEQIVDLLSDYRDGALGAAERDAVARHLPECADCAAYLHDQERLAKVLLRRAPAPSVFQTEAFAARVMARLPPAPEPLAWLTPRWLVPAFGMGFAVLALSFRSYPRVGGFDNASTVLLSADRGTVAAAATDDPLGLAGEDQ